MTNCSSDSVVFLFYRFVFPHFFFVHSACVCVRHNQWRTVANPKKACVTYAHIDYSIECVVDNFAFFSVFLLLLLCRLVEEKEVKRKKVVPRHSRTDLKAI